MIPDGLHPDLRPVVDRCLARFRSWTGREPDAVACAPGRVNLIGEHTDYNDGFVLPMAINRWCVAAGRRVDGPGRVLSGDLNQIAMYDPHTPDTPSLAPTPWARYPVGVMWTMRAHLRKFGERGGERVGGHPWSGADIVLASNVPIGSGLSSSAALEIATGFLANSLFGATLLPHELARIGRAAEHEFAGVPCGIMDQLACALARGPNALLIDCRTERELGVGLPNPRQAVFVIAHSGVSHALDSGEYAHRRESCRRAGAALGVPALCDADLALLGRLRHLLTPEDHACARHVLTENARVTQFVLALSRADLAHAGKLMNASHDSLRDDFRVSCRELDTLVEAARSIHGVLGSRMTGGGFGGCTVTLCRNEAAPTVCDVLGRAPAKTRELPMRPLVVSPAEGAQAWNPPF